MILIIGDGYIGNRCLKAWPDAMLSKKFINTKNHVLELIDFFQPSAIVNAVGIIGRPNVDWCETNQAETHFGNAVLPYYIASACQEAGIYLLHIGSGCIFYGDSPDPAGWREEDFANPIATYTKSKYAADLMLQTFPNVGIARIRMPIDHIPYSGNLIDKLIGYPKIIDVENSLTVLDDMVSVFGQLLLRKAAGIFHVTNPGAVKHKQIISWYQEFVNHEHANEWIEEDDLVKLGLAAKKRSNNILQSKNLTNLGITMRPAQEAVRDTIIKYAQHLRNNS